MKKKRAKIVASCIRDAYASLESHLDYASGKIKDIENIGSCKFHKKCVNEYAKLIVKLSQLY